MAQDGFWSRFRAWRRKRPFWGGLFLVVAALELLYTANMNLGSLEVHLGPQGFLSYLLPTLLLLCGLLCWFSPAQRLFYGIIGVLTALYTFVGLNLGGFFLGMLFGIVGGALVIAWGPPRVKPSPIAEAPDDDPAHEPSPAPAPSAGPVEVAGHDDRPHEADTAFIPGLGGPHPQPRSAGPVTDGQPGDGAPGPRRDGLPNPRALGVALLLIAVTGSILVAGSGSPARAEECPEGLPSRSPVATSASASAATTAPAPPTGAVPQPGTEPPAGGDPESPTATGSPTSSAPVPAGAEDGGSAPAVADDTADPVLDGIGDFFDGVGNLLGIGDASPSPSTSPSPSESSPSESSPSPGSASATTAVPASADPPGTASAPATPSAGAPAASGGSASSPRSVSPSASSDSPAPSAPSAGEEIPCLGARVLGLQANADGIPRVGLKPGVMEVGSLTMYNSTYDGVVDMPTSKGSFKALKFSMDKAVNKPFTLTVDEAGAATTVIKSNELVTDGNVRFYTPNFKGKLFGLIPVTFTPEQPPPLTLPVLWFTDVTIQLAYVHCDTLTADPLDIRERLTPAP